MDKELADLKEQAQGYVVALEHLLEQMRPLVIADGSQADEEALDDADTGLGWLKCALEDVGDDSRERLGT